MRTLCIALLGCVVSATAFANDADYYYDDASYNNTPVAATTAATPSTYNNWFISAGAAYNQYSGDKSTYAGQMPGAPADHYVRSSAKRSPSFAVAVGYKWNNLNGDWLPAYSLSLAYEYALPSQRNGDVYLYSQPNMNDYNYTYKLSEQTLMLQGKVDLFRLGNFMPYVMGGAGLALNRFSNFNETPKPGAYPGHNPGFQSANHIAFAYTIGAGIDYEFNEHVDLGLGYRYTSYGKFSSGLSTKQSPPPYNTPYKFSNHITGNQLLLNMAYVF